MQGTPATSKENQVEEQSLSEKQTKQGADVEESDLVEYEQNQDEADDGAEDYQPLQNYQIKRTLGKGNFGKVKLAVHKLTGEFVAVKILEKDLIFQQTDIIRIGRELKIMKKLRHPCVVQLYQIIETSKELYLVMEFAEKGDLFEKIVNEQVIDSKQAAKIYAQIALGMQYIHQKGVTHRDLKPENILLAQDGIKIADFGLGNTFKPQQKLKTACGSPCYASPEMLNKEAYDPQKIDIWSSGIILYAMICGYLPFEDPVTSKLYEKIKTTNFKLPSSVSSECRSLIRGLLSKDPLNRYDCETILSHSFISEAVLDYNQKLLSSEITSQEKIQEVSSRFGIVEIDKLASDLHKNRHNSLTTLYYLGLKSIERQRKNEIETKTEMQEQRTSMEEEKGGESAKGEESMKDDQVHVEEGVEKDEDISNTVLEREQDLQMLSEGKDSNNDSSSSFVDEMQQSSAVSCSESNQSAALNTNGEMNKREEQSMEEESQQCSQGVTRTQQIREIKENREPQAIESIELGEDDQRMLPGAQSQQQGQRQVRQKQSEQIQSDDCSESHECPSKASQANLEDTEVNESIPIAAGEPIKSHSDIVSQKRDDSIIQKISKEGTPEKKVQASGKQESINNKSQSFNQELNYKTKKDLPAMHQDTEEPDSSRKGNSDKEHLKTVKKQFNNNKTQLQSIEESPKGKTALEKRPKFEISKTSRAKEPTKTDFTQRKSAEQKSGVGVKKSHNRAKLQRNNNRIYEKAEEDLKVNKQDLKLYERSHSKDRPLVLKKKFEPKISGGREQDMQKQKWNQKTRKPSHNSKEEKLNFNSRNNVSGSHRTVGNPRAKGQIDSTITQKQTNSVQNSYGQRYATKNTKKASMVDSSVHRTLSDQVVVSGKMFQSSEPSVIDPARIVLATGKEFCEYLSKRGFIGKVDFYSYQEEEYIYILRTSLKTSTKSIQRGEKIDLKTAIKELNKVTMQRSNEKTEM